MFRLDVLQNQWLLLALGVGLVLVLCVGLFYLTLWKPRLDPLVASSAKPPVLKWIASFLPALLIVVYASIVVFIVVYTLAMVRHPPNW